MFDVWLGSVLTRAKRVPKIDKLLADLNIGETRASARAAALAEERRMIAFFENIRRAHPKGPAPDPDPD